MSEVMAIIGGVLICGGFWTFIQFLITRKDRKKEHSEEIAQAIKDLQSAVTELQKTANENRENMALQDEALMAIAQDRIVWLGEQYLKQGWVYASDYTSLKRMADAYRALGGNDLVKTTMDMVDKIDKRVKL